MGTTRPIGEARSSVDKANTASRRMASSSIFATARGRETLFMVGAKLHRHLERQPLVCDDRRGRGTGSARFIMASAASSKAGWPDERLTL